MSYLVDMHGKRKRRVFHVNVLKAFRVRQPVENRYRVEDVMGSDDPEDDFDFPVWNETLDEQPTIGEQVTEQQQEDSELREVLKDLKDVLRNEPGQTALVKHHIDTGTTNPVQRMSTEGARRDA